MKIGQHKEGDALIIEAQCEACGEYFDVPETSLIFPDEGDEIHYCRDCERGFTQEGTIQWMRGSEGA